ncbi:type II secretion system protein [Actinoplanes sp. URMC 104]|uniref:type II secretion system protein n=1 Tax=Actinoplanes sp. URMC 104 TaxID=3423409 RepID=UPI003F1938A7
MHDIINRLRNKKADEGFTLIELLVVVVIIGVLVAIAVPVYLNYRKGAADKSAQSDVRGAVSAIEQYYTDNGNAYPAPTTPIKSIASSFSLKDGSTTAGASQGGWVTLSDKTKMTYILAGGTPAGQSYTVCAKNDGGSGKLYVYDSSKGGSVQALANGNLDTCAATTP